MTDGTRRWDTEKHHSQGSERKRKCRSNIKRNNVLRGNVEMWQCYDSWETTFTVRLTGKWYEKDSVRVKDILKGNVAML